MQTTDIEKKSLEAHVDLCAQRYRFLENKLESVETKVTEQYELIEQVRDMVQIMSEKRNDQLLSWGGGVIMTLLGAIAWLLVTYVLV
jgi:3-dehydroquinate synthetase